MENIILVIHLVIVVAMILVILIQRTGSDGLSGLSGGGGGGGNALFSVRGKANILTKITSILATGFLITSLTLAYLATHKPGTSVVDKIASEKAAPAEAAPTADAKPAEEKKEAAPAAAPEVPLAE